MLKAKNASTCYFKAKNQKTSYFHSLNQFKTILGLKELPINYTFLGVVNRVEFKEFIQRAIIVKECSKLCVMEAK